MRWPSDPKPQAPKTQGGGMVPSVRSLGYSKSDDPILEKRFGSNTINSSANISRGFILGPSRPSAVIATTQQEKRENTFAYTKPPMIHSNAYQHPLGARRLPWVRHSSNHPSVPNLCSNKHSAAATAHDRPPPPSPFSKLNSPKTLIRGVVDCDSFSLNYLPEMAAFT
ncbi:hypothetical protein FRC16_005393 [Serendipita sp. 398]|nr:hypothetical protein FRC16_005393 [Serendipita sp. 398]